MNKRTITFGLITLVVIIFSTVQSYYSWSKHKIHSEIALADNAYMYPNKQTKVCIVQLNKIDPITHNNESVCINPGSVEFENVVPSEAVKMFFNYMANEMGKSEFFKCAYNNLKDRHWGIGVTNGIPIDYNETGIAQ